MAMLMEAARCECPACEIAAGAAQPNATTTAVAMEPERVRQAANRTSASRTATACNENDQPMASPVKVGSTPAVTSASPCARTSARVSRYCTHRTASHRPDHVIAHTRARPHVAMNPTTTRPRVSIDATSRAKRVSGNAHSTQAGACGRPGSPVAASMPRLQARTTSGRSPHHSRAPRVSAGRKITR